jgi:hypothetical protein
MPASTAAMMNTEREPTDCPPPLRNGWSLGTIKETVSTATAYSRTILSDIFLEPIFMLSASPRALLSAAVATRISIPVYEKATRVRVVLELLSKIRDPEQSVPYQTPRNVPTDPSNVRWTSPAAFLTTYIGLKKEYGESQTMHALACMVEQIQEANGVVMIVPRSR